MAISSLTTFSDCLEDKAGKVLGTASAGLHCLDPKKYLWAPGLANKIDEADCGFGIVYVMKDSALICAGTLKCVEVARSQGIASLKCGAAGVDLVKNVCSLASDGHSALKFLESGRIRVSFTSKLAPIAPFCDVGFYGIEACESLYRVANSESTKLGKKKWWQDVWECGKSGIYFGGAVAVVLGVVLAPVTLFALSSAALVVSMIAFFAKQDVKNYERLNVKGEET